MKKAFLQTRACALLLLLILFGGWQQGRGQTVTIGATTGTTNSYYYGPIYRSSASSTFDYSRYAHLYTAAELGIPTGATITKIEWLKYNGNTLTGNNTFNILLDNSTATTLTTGTAWNTLTATATTVYASTTQSFTGAAGTWESYTLPTPYTYTGNSLVVLADHVKAGTANGALNYYTNAATGKAIGTANSSVLTGTTTLTTTTYGNTRPTIRITYTPGTACSGTPNAGTAQANGSSGTVSVCSMAAVNLTNGGGSSATGLTYQWEYSVSGNAGTYNPISGATSNTYSIASYATSNAGYYQLVTTCSGQSATSAPVQLVTNAVANCYCTPSTTGATSKYISNFTTSGSVSNINNSSTAGSASGYEDYHTTITGAAYAGGVVNYIISVSTGTSGRAIWIDFNENGSFTDAGEQVVTGTSSYSSSPMTGDFSIPAGTLPGIKRMRILASNVPAAPTDPCAITSTGEYEDYSFEVLAATACSGSPAAATATASTASACSGEAITLSASGVPIGRPGNTYQWESRTGANPFAPISGATTVPYVLTTGQTAATDYRLVVTCSNSGLSTPSNTVSVGINPFNVCYCRTGLGGSTSAAITGATISGTTFDHTGGPSASPYYTQFPATGTNTGTLTQGMTYTISTTHSSTGYVSLWIDYDHSGTFDASEWTQINTATATSGSKSFTIPAGAMTGQTGMRIRTRTSTYTGTDNSTVPRSIPAAAAHFYLYRNGRLYQLYDRRDQRFYHHHCRTGGLLRCANDSGFGFGRKRLLQRTF